jgi:hypothetical protein
MNQRLSIYEKEFLAVIMAVDKWRQYLQRAPFTIVTDHQSLSNLNDQLLTTELQNKAMAKLVGLQFEIKYRKGADNGAADSLSRVGHLLATQSASVCKPAWLQEVLNSYTTDPHSTALLQELAVHSLNGQGFSLDHGLIKYKGRLFIGENLALQTKLISSLHDSAIGGHSGVQASYQRIKQLYYWPGMKLAVENYVKQCSVCQLAKHSHHKPDGLLQPLPRNRLSPRFINKATTSIQSSPTSTRTGERQRWGNSTNKPNIKQKDERAPRSGHVRQTGGMERRRAASSSARSISSTRSRSRCLHNGYHSCKEANILKTESEARRGKILSITILLRVVHKVQDIAANMNQKRWRLVPVRFAWVSRNSPRSQACHAGPRASWTKLHRNRAAGQVNIMWVLVSGIPHNGHNPSPGPCLLATSTPEGKRSRNNCHTKIFVFRGRGAFQSGDVQGREGPLNRALYAELTEKIPEGVNLQATQSEEVEREGGSLALSSTQAADSSMPKVLRNATFQVPSCTAAATRSIGSAQNANKLG